MTRRRNTRISRTKMIVTQMMIMRKKRRRKKEITKRLREDEYKRTL